MNTIQNIIGVIFDFDITISPEYMQSPIFEEYDIKPGEFWDCAKTLKEKQDYDDEHAYMRLLIEEAKSGRAKGLNNAKLRELGGRLKFYSGVPRIFDDLKNLVEKDLRYSKHGISIEFYIVSSGLEEMIRGCELYKAEYFTDVWGCTFDEEDGIITFPKTTVSHTTKTQKLFMIDKGLVGKQRKNPLFDVNARVPDEKRRIPFANMIYVGDGPSDVPSFSLIRDRSGLTIAVYRPNDYKAFQKCYTLAVDAQRAHMFAPADYSEGTPLYFGLKHMVESIATRVSERLEEEAQTGVVASPQH